MNHSLKPTISHFSFLHPEQNKSTGSIIFQWIKCALDSHSFLNGGDTLPYQIWQVT